MVDSTLVLWGQTVAYTLYVLAIMAVMAWFAWRISKPGKAAPVKAWLFYSFVGLLVVIGVSLHFITYETIPWKSLDMNRHTIKADRVFDITVEKHEFALPAEKLEIKCGEKALFNVTSKDLTYGFGLFRLDNSMVFQMQVLPGHVNDILWHFDRAGTYTIRSTEYSGPAGVNMVVRDAVVVTCDDSAGQANAR